MEHEAGEKREPEKPEVWEPELRLRSPPWAGEEEAGEGPALAPPRWQPEDEVEPLPPSSLEPESGEMAEVVVCEVMLWWPCFAAPGPLQPLQPFQFLTLGLGCCLQGLQPLQVTQSLLQQPLLLFPFAPHLLSLVFRQFTWLPLESGSPPGSCHPSVDQPRPLPVVHIPHRGQNLQAPGLLWTSECGTTPLWAILWHQLPVHLLPSLLPSLLKARSWGGDDGPASDWVPASPGGAWAPPGEPSGRQFGSCDPPPCVCSSSRPPSLLEMPLQEFREGWGG